MANEKSAPGAIVGLLGPSPLLNGENAEHYNQLLSRVTEELEAEDDVILQILIKQFIDGYWESSRYGRHRAVMIDRRVQQGLEFQAERRKKQKEQTNAALERIATKLGQPRDEFVRMIERERLIQSTVEDVDAILDRTPSEAEYNRAIEDTIVIQRQFDVLIESATRRQDSALMFAERHATLKQERKPAKEIVEAEYVALKASAESAVEGADDVGTQNNSQPSQ